MKQSSEPSAEGVRYAAFLRGINVGGHRLIKMAELAEFFRGMGLRDVRTVIASGNVVCTSDDDDTAALTQRIEAGLAVGLGYHVTVILRTVAQLRTLVAQEPFATISDPDVHRYVIFFPALPATVPELPAHYPELGFSLLGLAGRDVLVAARRLPDGGRADFGPLVAKQFGKISTARNWNTVVKIAAM